MTSTRTRTMTYVSIIGSELAAKSKNLAKAAEEMRKVVEKYKDDMEGRGCGYKETNDPAKLSLLRMQWTDVMKLFARRDELREIQELLGKDGE